MPQQCLADMDVTSCKRCANFRPCSNGSHCRTFKGDGKIGSFSSVKHLGPKFMSPGFELKFGHSLLRFLSCSASISHLQSGSNHTSLGGRF